MGEVHAGWPTELLLGSGHDQDAAEGHRPSSVAVAAVQDGGPGKGRPRLGPGFSLEQMHGRPDAFRQVVGVTFIVPALVCGAARGSLRGEAGDSTELDERVARFRPREAVAPVTQAHVVLEPTADYPLPALA